MLQAAEHQREVGDLIVGQIDLLQVAQIRQRRRDRSDLIRGAV